MGLVKNWDRSPREAVEYLLKIFKTQLDKGQGEGH